MSRPAHGDAEARRRIAEDLSTTFVVEAAAGTGKTTALVSRIVAVLRHGRTTLDALVAVTFTEKAAGEMKLRLRAAIEKARRAEDTPDEERIRLDRSLESLEVARIGTIHSLCTDLLHERPVEARVDPIFAVAAEDEARGLYEQAFETWFQEALASPPEGVRRLLRRRPRGRDQEGPRAALEDAGYRLIGQRDFTCPWRREPFAREPWIDRLVLALERLSALVTRCRANDDYLVKCLELVARWIEELGHREAVRGRDYDGLEAEFRDLANQRAWTWRGSARAWPDGATEHQSVLGQRDELKAELDAFLLASEADLAACLEAELRPLVAAHERLKARAGKLDFLDLLLRARDLLREHRAVREELQARYTHVFVDEFQDTDPLQAEILFLLAADAPGCDRWKEIRVQPGKLFVVGDPKQSIYRFRRADITLYEAAKTQLLERGAELLYLSTSFRSAPAVQGVVNAAFAAAMAPMPNGRQASYVRLEADRPELGRRPSVVALPVPKPYGDYGKIVHWKIEESYPEAVAAFIEHLLQDEEWMVSGRTAEAPPERVLARHVCVLLKRFQSGPKDLTRSYVEALEKRRIAHVLVGGRSFHSREEVAALRTALVAIEWPEDELSVYATLRGPWFAYADAALLAFRHEVGPFQPMRRLDAASLTPHSAEVAEALRLLARLHRGRNRRPIADTIAMLLEATRAHAGVAVWPTGEQALANLLRMTDHARRFELGGATSFRAFVDRLVREAERGDASEAPVVEEGTDGVRIMTVHRAKGLEFPVVILADPTARAVRTMPTRHVDPERGLWAEPLAWCAPIELLEAREEALQRDREEAVRLAYVAATRARDLLVVPVVGDEEQESWLDVLNPAVYPVPEARRLSEPAPGCPPFGEDSVADRGAGSRVGVGASVKPGLVTPRVGAHRVVWWDPLTLNLDRTHDVGVRQRELFLPDEGEVAASAGERAHEAWQARREAVNERASRPSVQAVSATALSAAIAAQVEAAEVEAAGVEAAGVEAAGAGVEAAGVEAAETEAAGAGVEGPDAAAGRAARIQNVSRDLPVTAALRALGPELDEDLRVEHEVTAEVGAARPHGNRFGALVHALLASIELDADEDRMARLGEIQGRILGAPSAEVTAAVRAVRAALAHPLLERARSASTCRREASLVFALPDGTLVDGIVDLAFRELEGRTAKWTVVDFKTDIEISSRGMRQYEAQVRLYARGIGRATGEAVRAVLLRV